MLSECKINFPDGGGWIFKNKAKYTPLGLAGAWAELDKDLGLKK